MTDTRAVEALALHDGALDATGLIVARTRADHLSLPTPCDQWDVRGLIEHLVEGNHMFALAATTGATLEVVGDPFEAYARSAAAVRQAWRQPDVLQRDVTLPFGTVPGWVAVRMHFVDHLVHGWDLAEATGQDTTLDERLASAAFEEMTAALGDAPRGAGMPFGPEVPWSSDAPVHERLVAFLGRRP